MEILVIAPIVGTLFFFSCAIGCCVQRRVRVLEERVSILEQRPILISTPSPQPQYYMPLPSAPVANWTGPDLEHGVRVV
jgi:hypothetical protein